MCRCLSWLALVLLLTACNLTNQQQPTPEVKPDAPTVEFLYPINGSLVVENTDVQIELLAKDENGVGVARVELLVDDIPHQEGMPQVSAAVTIFTVSMNWLAETPGLHSMTAIAYRPDGSASEPTVITLQVIAVDASAPPNP